MTKPDWMERLESASARDSAPSAVYRKVEDMMGDVRVALDEIRHWKDRAECEARRTRQRVNEVRQATDEMRQACVEAMKRWQIVENQGAAP